jgi:hypothetical protein
MEHEEYFENMKKYIPEELWEDLMYMYSEGDISLYKHYDTRNYINVDSKGNFYLPKDNIFNKVSKETALKSLFS